MGAGSPSRIGLAMENHCQQALNAFRQDVRYVSGVWNGEVSQSNRGEAAERNNRLILIGIRSLMAMAFLRVACDAVKILGRMSRLNAFGFLDRTLIVLFEAVLFHDIFRYTCNLTNRADLQQGLRAQFLVTGTENDRNGRALNPYLKGTIVPSVWNTLFYHLRASRVEAARFF